MRSIKVETLGRGQGQIIPHHYEPNSMHWHSAVLLILILTSIPVISMASSVKYVVSDSCEAAKTLKDKFKLEVITGSQNKGRLVQVKDKNKDGEEREGFQFDVYDGDKKKNQERYVLYLELIVEIVSHSAIVPLNSQI